MWQDGTGPGDAPLAPLASSVRYWAALGGSATLGKHVARPFPALLEGTAGCPVVNLGALNAGPDFYLADPERLQIAAGAGLVILQLAGAEGVTNPFYTVHSRRNDRFVGATRALHDLFPGVDFAEIHFTRHLLAVLHQTDPKHFALVAHVLRATWLERMQALLRHLPPRRILLLLSRAASPEGADDPLRPALVDRMMIAALCTPTTRVVKVALQQAPGAWLPDADDHGLIARRLGAEVGRTAAAPLILRQIDRVA